MKNYNGLADPIRRLHHPEAHPSGLTSLPVGHKRLFKRDDLFMVEPNGFRLSGEINAWMKLTDQPKPTQALSQWRALHATLVRAGFQVELARQPEAWPDYVFSANAGLAVALNGTRIFIPSQFRHVERQGEQALYEAYFVSKGYQIVHLFDRDETWEGEGDCLEHRGVLFGGYGWRSRVTAHQKLANYLGLPLVTLHLDKPHYYHLDTALAFLNERTGLWYPGAFESKSREALERHFAAIPGGRLLEVHSDDAAKFACNAVVLGSTIVMNTVSDGLVQKLEAEGFRVFQTPLSEFMKSGGAAKCLTLFTPAMRLQVAAPLRSA